MTKFKVGDRVKIQDYYGVVTAFFKANEFNPEKVLGGTTPDTNLLCAALAKLGDTNIYLIQLDQGIPIPQNHQIRNKNPKQFAEFMKNIKPVVLGIESHMELETPL